MTTLKLVLAFSFLSCSAFAGPFDGTWTGTGNSVMKPGSAKAHSRPCSEITMSFSQKGNQITMSGEYACEDLQASYDPSTFDIRGTDLLFEGQKVGVLTPSTFALDYLDPEDGSTFRLTLSLGKDGLGYREEWLVGPESQMLTVGKLSLSHSETGE